MAPVVATMHAPRARSSTHSQSGGRPSVARAPALTCRLQAAEALCTSAFATWRLCPSCRRRAPPSAPCDLHRGRLRQAAAAVAERRDQIEVATAAAAAEALVASRALPPKLNATIRAPTRAAGSGRRAAPPRRARSRSSSSRARARRRRTTSSCATSRAPHSRRRPPPPPPTRARRRAGALRGGVCEVLRRCCERFGDGSSTRCPRFDPVSARSSIRTTTSSPCERPRQRHSPRPLATPRTASVARAGGGGGDVAAAAAAV